jgi:uncharacterized protein YecE (DUF72 family)
VARAYVGTSGFSYPEWRGSFYPAGLGSDELLAYYGRIFPTCEINNTFYRHPSEAVLAAWAAAVPPTFRFAIKAHRRITHLKRLADVDGDLAVLYERVRLLADRLGVVLFQLPPTLRYDEVRLRTFLAQLRPGAHVVIEFRHDSWRREEVYRLLADHRVSLAAGETDETAQPRLAVGPIAYLRLHKYRYTDDELAERAAWLREQLASGRDVYAYFTHEEGTPGPAYAQHLMAMLAS